MLPISETGTLGLLNLALDATVMRQQAIAQNIANAGVAGYQRLGVTFEQRFAGLQGGMPLPAGAAFQPSLALVGKPGDTVALDQEMAALSETTLHHQALLKVLNKNLSLLSVAINEGKR